MPSRRYTLYLLTIISLLAGLLTGRAIFFNIAYLLGALLILAMFWAWLAVRGIGLQRITRNRRSQVGRNFNESFVIRNTILLPKLWLEVRDHSDLPGHRASHVIPSLGARSRYEWHVDTPCTVRGEFQLGPVTITSGDPFGFFTLPRRVNAAERILIYPATVPIRKFNLPVGLLTGGDAQRYMTPNVTTDAAGVRDYVPGDSINRIHWRSTARRDRLIVKEFELDPLIDVWLFVDFSAHSLIEEPIVQRRGGTGTIIPGTQAMPPSTEEYAVVVAASLASYFVDIERALGFAAYVPHREVYMPERGHRQLTRILETLAVARSLSERSLREALSLESSFFARGSTVVIITSSQDPAWVQEAQLLTRRGIRTMCLYIDPSSFAGGKKNEELLGMLNLARIPTIVIRKGDDLTTVLGQRPV